MAMPAIASEIAKIALAKIAEIKPDDVAKAARAIGKATSTGSMLVPGLGVLGAGILIGTGIGYLTAPRAGRETRQRLVTSVKRKLSALTQRTRTREEPLPASEELLGQSGGPSRAES